MSWKSNRITRFVFESLRLMYGCVAYLFSGRTPAAGYQGMIGLFCTTGGVSNDMLSGIVGAINGKCTLPPEKGILGSFSDAELKQVKSRLDADGYLVFEKVLPAEVHERLMGFALATPSRIRAGKNVGAAASRMGIYNRHKPEGVRYDFLPEDVINNVDVQRLMSDTSILALAQAYLGSRPVADVTNMWWHTAFSHEPDSDAAQFFHFDMDRIRWLKFFFYLTDVGPQSGPHCFVRGSHRTGGIPRQLLKKGYARLTDEEVSTFYEKDRIIEFHAPAGTLIVEDTRGLHKGKVVERGDRLMLQLQFSNSLFGGSYPKARFGVMTPELKKIAESEPGIYANYL
ncbi:MAG TPA: phytanoyl-CoA dioxygenase family protein [Burkholderiales bacterium]|nr:phytanoyl-CoA dioxygenase family protein [Burkholderiales bacterium]